MQRRNTKQRQLILQNIRNRYDHPTADQIFEDVSKKDKTLSRGTVYRNLSVLSQEGEIKSIELPDANRFDLRVDNHYHFVCINCNKVFDIDIDYENKLDNTITTSGFLIQTHDTVFKGLCPECAKK